MLNEKIVLWDDRIRAETQTDDKLRKQKKWDLKE